MTDCELYQRVRTHAEAVKAFLVRASEATQDSAIEATANELRSQLEWMSSEIDRIWATLHPRK